MNIEDIKLQVKNAESLLKILANSNRLLILCHLLNKSATVNELSHDLQLSQSATSQHLAKLRRANIVDTQTSGTSVTYSIDNPQVNAIIALLQVIYCADKT